MVKISFNRGLGLNSRKKRGALIISGMFRSGTSLPWRILTADSYYNKYFYEPLHPYLPEEVKSLEIYNDYKNNPDILKSWSSSFHLKKFFLNKNDDYPELKEYLDLIIQDRSLIKFTRMTMRLGWLKNHFPNIFIINIVRDPRAVCYSYCSRQGIQILKKENLIKKLYNDLKKKKTDKSIISLMLEDTKKELGRIRSKHRKPSAYWHQEILESIIEVQHWREYIEKLLKKEPYVKILGLWKINVEQSLKDLKSFEKDSITVIHEELCKNSKKIFEKIYSKLNIEIPSKIINEIENKNPSHKYFKNSHKFHLKISQNWLERWKVIDDKIWKDALEETEAIDLMKSLGYKL